MWWYILNATLFHIFHKICNMYFNHFDSNRGSWLQKCFEQSALCALYSKQNKTITTSQTVSKHFFVYSFRSWLDFPSVHVPGHQHHSRVTLLSSMYSGSLRCKVTPPSALQWHPSLGIWNWYEISPWCHQLLSRALADKHACICKFLWTQTNTYTHTHNSDFHPHRPTSDLAT